MSQYSRLVLIAFLVLIPINGNGAEVSFDKSVQPLLKKYCQDCHGPEEANSKIRVDVLSDQFTGKELFSWDKIHHVLETSDADFRMPPEDEQQPSEAERTLLVKWISEKLNQAKKENAKNNGYSRRLTKVQYRNTLRDLLLLDEDFTTVMPNDGITKEGYNSTEVMQISPMHMEYYFEIASKALDAAIVDETKIPQIQNFRVNLGKGINQSDFQENLILGAKSRLVPIDSYTIDELTPQKDFDFSLHKLQRKFTFIEGYIGNGTIREKKEFNSIYHNVFACLRGQDGYPKGLAETVIKDGLLLRPSLPNTELFRMGSTYGPSPNFKISLRELPKRGNFRVKVRASKYDDAYVLDRGHPRYPLKFGRSVVFDATQKENTHLEIPEDGVYQLDLTYLSKPNVNTLNLAIGGIADEYRIMQTREGKIDLVTVPGDGKLVDSITIQDSQKGNRSIHLAEVEVISKGKNIAKEAKLTFSSEHYKNVAANLIDGKKDNLFQTSDESKPWVTLSFDQPVEIDSVILVNTKEPKVHSRIIGAKVSLKEGKKTVVDYTVSPTYAFMTRSFKLMELKKGKVSVSISPAKDMIVKEVILSRLEQDDPLTAKFHQFKKRDPQLSVYMGFRRDCGSALTQVNLPQTVSDYEPKDYYFSDAINNYPISHPAKNNQNYLAGVSEIGVRNEFLDGRDAPRLLIHSVEFEGPFYEQWPPKAHQNIFIQSANKNDSSKYAKEIISNFMKRAYRRPVTEKEVQFSYQVWSDSFKETNNFHSSIKDALLVILCSPQFLLITDASQSEKDENVSEFELATKLSYFLWNSPPDAELMQLAEKGKLKASLDEQVDRMLADPKRESFLKTFATQWLNLDKIGIVETNAKKYPQLTKHVKNSLEQEPIKFLGYLLDHNLELKNIIDSDFTLANDVISGYYGLEGYETGMKFTKVNIPDYRGGLLSQAGVLVGLSDGNESNPVKRGNWIARKIVAEPPGEPPPNVPELGKPDGKLTLRQRLEKHRNQQGCVKCHTKIDPWGVPFEVFDAGGIYHAEIDSSSKLPDGSSVKNLKELKKYLSSDKMDQVAFSFMQHLSTYALGRSLTFKELDDLKQSRPTLKQDGYPIRDIVKHIVKSDMFCKK